VNPLASSSPQEHSGAARPIGIVAGQGTVPASTEGGMVSRSAGKGCSLAISVGRYRLQEVEGVILLAVNPDLSWS
jgi:hypothetical protein